MKTIITGGSVTAKKLYHDPVKAHVRAKLIFASNFLPQSDDTTDGFFRRLIVVKLSKVFNRKSEGYDPMLKFKLTSPENMPGILNSILNAYTVAKSRGYLEEPEESQIILESLRSEADEVAMFVQEECEVGENFMVSVNDLFNEFLVYCNGVNVQTKVNRVWFTRRIQTIVPSATIGRNRVNREQVRVINGIRLKLGKESM